MVKNTSLLAMSQYDKEWKPYMKITLHQTQLKVADFNNIIGYLDSIKTDGLHLLPELFLTGYPLQDLCLQKSFIDSYQKVLKRLEKKSKTPLMIIHPLSGYVLQNRPGLFYALH